MTQENTKVGTKFDVKLFAANGAIAEYNFYAMNGTKARHTLEELVETNVLETDYIKWNDIPDRLSGCLFRTTNSTNWRYITIKV